MVRFKNKPAGVGSSQSTCPIAEELRVHAAAAEYIVKCVMERPFGLRRRRRRGRGQGRTLVIGYPLVHSYGVSGPERRRAEMLVKGRQQGSIALTRGSSALFLRNTSLTS